MFRTSSETFTAAHREVEQGQTPPPAPPSVQKANDRSIKLNKWSLDKLVGAKAVVRTCFCIESEGAEEPLYTWTTPEGVVYHERALFLPPPKGHYRIVLCKDVNGEPTKNEHIIESE